ncbi:glycosyltransferase [Acinetobacter baumannii]
MDPIRVLHIVGKMDRAGAETMLMNLYRHIDRSEVQFDFVTFTNDMGDYDNEILALGGKIIPLSSSNSILRMFELKSFLKKHPEYQIVHSHVLLNNAFHLLAAKKVGVKNRISHSHNTSNGEMRGIKKIYEKWAKNVINCLSTYKISCGKEAAEYLFNSTENVWLLNNAIDLKQYSEISLQNKNYWSGIGNVKGLKLIQVGRLNEVKNHKFSLKIAKKLKDKGVEFTFFIVGKGPLESFLKAKVKEYALTDFVYFLGVRDDVPELMAGADLMLMPSLHEGFPVVLVESQAIGIDTIVSSNISSEVDLGLDLIEFQDINFVDDWVSTILNWEKSIQSSDRIFSLLKGKGFDVKSNAKDLKDFYKAL